MHESAAPLSQATSTPRVIVGVDGSPDSVAALRMGEWAAASRGGRLVAVTAWRAPMIAPRASAVMPDMHQRAIEMQQEAIAAAFHGRSIVPIETVTSSGRAGAVLVEASRGAALLIVGSRGRGGFAGLLLGSVSMACTMHASCPVLVLHDGDRVPDDGSGQRSRVVVGVSNGPAAVRVLRVAAAAAVEMGAELLAVATWNDQVPVDSFIDMRTELEEAARGQLEASIEAAFPDGRPPGLRAVLREGGTAHALVTESAQADLVVVGRRGHAEFAGVLLGSISLPVAEHAASPVLVVPTPAQSKSHSASTDDHVASGFQPSQKDTDRSGSSADLTTAV